MSVLAQLERLDHRFVGRPETTYVFESRSWRLRIALVVMLTNLSLVIAFVSNQQRAGVFLLVFSVATLVKIVLAKRAWRRTAVQASGRFFEI